MPIRPCWRGIRCLRFFRPRRNARTRKFSPRSAILTESGWRSLPCSGSRRKEARGCSAGCGGCPCGNAGCRENGQDLFTRCFGQQTASAWYPFANAVYCWEKKPADSDYQLDACRSYRCRDGAWEMLTWEGRFFDLELFHGLLRQTDAMLRRYLKTGNYLKERPEEAWISPCVRAVIEAEKKEAEEAARPRVVLDLSGLDQIRRDALITRDSLLTDEERAEAELETAEPPQAAAPGQNAPPELPLDDVQLEILRALLAGKPASGIIRAHRLMPAMTADIINEALFDEIGDSIVECDNDTLSLVKDYREDLTRLLGGNHS